MGKRGTTGSGASSQNALAAAMGVSRQTVTKWVKRDDWPVPRRGPWTAGHVRTIREWRRGHRTAASREAAESDGSNGVLETLANHPERLAKLRLLLTRRELLELDRGIKAGEYVKLADVEAGRVARIQAVKEMLLQQKQRVGHRLRAVVKSEKTIGKITAIIDTEARRILKTFAGQGPEADD